MVLIFPAYPFPNTFEGYYATNNPFQKNGPKGFTESKMIGLRKLFVRTDLPGVGQGSITHQVSDGVLRLVITMTPINNQDQIPNDQEEVSECKWEFCCSDMCGAAAEFTGPILLVHPDLLTEGLRMAYAYKQLQDGSAHVRLDMPGVPKGDFTAEIENGRVIVTGRAPAVSHDSNGRFYSAVAATISNTTGTNPLFTVEGGPENGVLRLNIRPA
ncbi:hypothetical protein F2Q68_00037025 [Brassica cretica]|uniref:SHSP domain-containing protein n=1 Tax=Brassica cretica TaxID=69181 RepID=A0A8S9H1G1_BRACR|nr:hypothetical protein F2Q68_00037025 [Brassica cretica]